MKSLKRVMLAMFLTLSLTAISALAQDEEAYPDQDQVQDQAPVQDQQASQPAQSDQNDPPGRAARLQYMSGSVSIQPRGTEDWVAGSLNRPLTIADNVWTDKESRAELNVGTGVMRMGDETSLTLTNVSDSTVQVELHQGTLDVHVRHLFGGEIYEIDTPNAAFTIQKSGVYRVDVDPNGDATVVTVRKGDGDATGQGPAVRVKSNQQVRFTDGTSLTHSVAEAPPYDGFDDWCAVRDKREDSSLSARYVAPGTVGYEDLDDYGVWREEPMYGHVWVPVVAPGWAPYQAGHWIWVEPWGWTWVDDAPWGYAPFHYGRWVYTGGNWGWAPGPIYARPVYAPALVAWFGGPGWGVNFGFGAGGGLGWCALGWGEPFYPWYHGGYNYFRGVNVSNTRIVNIHNYWGHPPNRLGGGNFHYANMRAPGGITTAPVRTLQNGMAVRGTAVRMSARDFAGAPMGRVGVTPTRNAMLGVHAGQRAAAPPSRSGMRPVVARMNPPASFNRGGTAVGGQKPFAGRNEPLTPSRMIPHGPESASGRVPSPAVRGTVARPAENKVQRPGMNGAEGGRSNSPQRPVMNNTQGDRENNPQIAHNVPRPPVGGMQPSRTPESRGPASNGPQSRGGFSPSPAERSVPRPPANFGGSARENSPSMTSRGESRPGMGSYGNRPSTAVPRPTGPVRPASQSERSTGNGGWASNRGASASPEYRGSNSSPAYRGGSNSPSRGDSSRNSAPTSYRNSGPSYGGSGSGNRGGSPYGGGSPSYRSTPSYRSVPSYGGGSPSYRSAPSYGGGSPSYRSAPSYGGGGGSRGSAAPSYHGGGGGASSSRGGGGNSGGGGGGRSSSGGGHGGHR
jgi:hypothetical protein